MSLCGRASVTSYLKLVAREDYGWALLGFLGITVAGMAIVKGSFWFCMGLVMAAGANSFVQQYPFAASDYVQDTIKSQAISRVLIGGIAAGIIGPQLVTYNKDLLYPIPFAGAFLMVPDFLLSFLVMILLPLKFLRHERLIEKKEEQGKSLSKIKPLLPPCYVGPVATL